MKTALIQQVELLAKACLQQQKKIAVAESCTGGGLAYYLTSVPGSSAWFERGFVTYTGAAKQSLLGVPAETIAAHGEVSAETAEAMVAGTLANSLADVAVSITGIAGPGGATANKPVGLVWFGFAEKGKAIQSTSCVFDGDRAAVRLAAIDYALSKLAGLFRNP